MKNTAVQIIVCTLMGLVIADANRAQAAHVFSDGFETGTAGAAIGAPWGLNGSVTVTSTYVNPGPGANPFPNGGTQFADFNDADSTPGSGATIRLLSHAGADTSAIPFLSGQISTYSFDFIERAPNEAVGAGMIVGYYRTQANPDLNSAGRNYSSNLHDGSLNPIGTLLGGAALTYTTETVNTVFMIVNDSATPFVNYQPGRTLADTSADFWLLRPGDAGPVYAFSVDKQSVASAVAGVGFRSNSGDAEHFAVDNVFLNAGATFDRSLAGPAFPTLVINRTTGEISLQNRETVDINVKGYTISSAIGALDVAAWDSIADTGDQNSGNSFDSTSVWTETSATNLQLAESANTGTGGVLQATTGNRSLGDGLWVRSPFQDLVATYTAGDGSTVLANVVYEGAAIVSGDINGDGSINVTDWNAFRAGSGASFTGQTRLQSYLGGDLDGDFDNDFADFRRFKAVYVAVNGAGAFAALEGVPEPSTIALAVISLVGLAFGRRQRTAKLKIMTLIFAVGVIGAIGHVANAATPVTYQASGDPGLFPDSNGQVDDAWFTSIPAASGSGFFGFPANGIPDNHWILFSTQAAGDNGSIQADHAFDSPLSVGQAVSLDFANSAVAVAAGINQAGVVGVSLTSGGTPVATFKFTGGDTLYRYDDAGGTDQSTGIPFAFRSYSSLEFRIDSATGYTAAYGNPNGTSLWSGTTTGGPIDGIRVFNTDGGNGSDVIFDNLTIGPTTIVPLTLEVNKSNGEVKLKGHATLAASIDFYQIASAGNALNFTPGTGANQWNSLDRQNLNAVDGTDGGLVAGDSPTEGWDAATTASKGRLAEYFVRSGGSAVPTAGELQLGRAYDNSVFGAADGDLAFSYAIAGSSRLMTGVVSYVTSPGVIGDYNGNGIVDAADYTVWRDHLGQVFALPNRDPVNGTGAINAADYNSWKSHFGSSGSGASTASAQGVPEPNPSLLLLLGVFCFFIWRRQ